MLIFLIYSYSTCVISKGCMLKYKTNSCANISTKYNIWGILSVKIYYNTILRINNKRLSDIDDCMQNILYIENIKESYFETRISMQQNQKTKSSMALPPDPDCATQVILRGHYQCYCLVRYLQQEKYHQYLFKIIGSFLIANLILLGKCGLREISFQRCQQLNKEVEKEKSRWPYERCGRRT